MAPFTQRIINADNQIADIIFYLWKLSHLDQRRNVFLQLENNRNIRVLF